MTFILQGSTQIKAYALQMGYLAFCNLINPKVLEMFENINRPAFFVLVIYPLMLITAGVAYASSYSLGWFELGMFVVGYYVSNITVGIGLHRLWSHDSYKTNKFVEFILMMFAAGTLQGPALSWASNHFKHHTYTDTDKDPHTPLKYENRFMGFFWSHMGWMLAGDGSYKSVDRITMVKLGRNGLLRFQLRYYWQLALFMNLFLPMMIGFALTQSIVGAISAYVFIGLGRALQQQITFFVNSMCHFFGTQKYTDGTSRDVWWLALFLLGENWHNFHHAFPSDYRNGSRWYQMDVHKWIIYLMSVFGLAWGLKRTDEARINAKVIKTQEGFEKQRRSSLVLMQDKVNVMFSNVQQKISELENLSTEVKDNLQKSFNDMQNNLAALKSQIANFENPSNKILDAISKKVSETENALSKLYSELEKYKKFCA